MRLPLPSLTVLSASLMATLLAGCADVRENDPVAASASAIQGGARDDVHKFSVGILIGGGGTCSGALIAPYLVITARHCVDSIAQHTSFNQPVDCARDTFGKSSGAKFSSDDRYGDERGRHVLRRFQDLSPYRQSRLRQRHRDHPTVQKHRCGRCCARDPARLLLNDRPQAVLDDGHSHWVWNYLCEHL